MIALPPVDLGGTFTSSAAGSQQVTPTANLSTGQTLYAVFLSQSTITPIAGSGGAGTWVTDVVEFAQSTFAFMSLLRYNVPTGDNGTKPTFTFSWTGSHTVLSRLVGLTGANTTPTNGSAETTYNGTASPLTGPSVTPSVLSCAILTFYGEAVTSASAATNSSGWATLVASLQTNKSILVDYKSTLTTDTTTAQNDTSTWATTGQGLALVIAVAPAPSGGGTTPVASSFVPFPLGGAGGTSAGSAALRRIDREIRRRYR